MQITDIVKGFSTMSREELEELIKKNRGSRVTRKEVSLQTRPTKETGKKVDSVSKTLDGLSDAEKAALKKLLGK